MATIRSYATQGLATVLVNLIFVWGATQWAAYQLDFQEALGAPWVTVQGYPVYDPWMLFPWWLSFGTEAPRVFDTGGAIAALGGVFSAALALGGSRPAGGSNKNHNNLWLGPLGGCRGYQGCRIAGPFRRDPGAV